MFLNYVRHFYDYALYCQRIILVEQALRGKPVVSGDLSIAPVLVRTQLYQAARQKASSWAERAAGSRENGGHTSSSTLLFFSYRG